MKPEESNILSVKSMLPYLSQDIRTHISERIFIYKSLESTNITAKDMAITGAEHATVIIADSQTAGKGCHGKSFHSPPAFGLYISFILYPEMINYNLPASITAFAAVSVCQAIESVSDKTPRIKRVNDIFLDGKKICGILTESVIGAESHNTHFIILGIGVNFNTPISEFPEELKHIAGSLFEAKSPPVTRNRLAAEIINRIIAPEYQYSEEEMLKLYEQRLL